MNWNIFFKSLENLNSDLTATSEKKNEAYRILLEHNKRAELDFIIRLTTRKINKMIKHGEMSEEYKKEIIEKFNPNPNHDFVSFKTNTLGKFESNHLEKNKEYFKENELTYEVNVEVGTPNKEVPTSFLYSLHI